MNRRCSSLAVAAMACSIILPMASAFNAIPAFHAIPALNLPALQAKRSIGMTLRDFRTSELASPESAAGMVQSRRTVLQHGVAVVGGIALTMSSGADAEELKGYKLVDIFRVSVFVKIGAREPT